MPMSIARKPAAPATWLAAGFAVLASLASAPALAVEVARGCDAPPDTPHGRTFFIDPERGSMANDGSEAKPWRTLAEVLAPGSRMVATMKWRENSKDGSQLPINPDGPIHPGDTLVLMSGDHGDVDLKQFVNRDFIFVVAGKDQTPVVDTLRVTSSTHWLFRGIKFQHTRTPISNAVVSAISHGWMGPSNNLVFVENSVSATDSTDSWSEQDWVDKPYEYAFGSSGPCTTFAHNHVYNVRDAVTVSGENTLVADNVIERFGNDGVDVTSSNTVVRGNLIRDSMHSGKEPKHPDGIQGWGSPHDVTFDSNRVININGGGVQGIDVFDGDWRGLRVTNNLVITNVWNGMVLFGLTDSLVANNTIIAAGRETTWLSVAPAKDHRPSHNVIVRNNIATKITVEAEASACDHNVAALAFSCKITDQPGARDPRLDKNWVDKSVFRSIGFDPASSRFDLRPTPASPAYKAGSDEGVPKVDITGRERIAPYDIGAFAR